MVLMLSFIPVSTLPIRNGNEIYNIVYFELLDFLNPVSTLPIRNGNINHNGTLGEARLTPNATPKSKYLTYKEWKLRLICLFCRRLILVSTLPIRNGNSQNALHSSKVMLVSGLMCEYLTYKEWKRYLLPIMSVIKLLFSEYLTYKEWKLLFFRRINFRCSRKYLTYKEWKRLQILSRLCWSWSG